MKPTEIFKSTFELSSCQKRTRTVERPKPWPWFPEKQKQNKKQHVRSPQLTPKHKKIVFTCLLRNINALGVLDPFLCSVEARLLGKPRKIPHTTFKKSTLWKQIAFTKQDRSKSSMGLYHEHFCQRNFMTRGWELNWIAGTYNYIARVQFKKEGKIYFLNFVRLHSKHRITILTSVSTYARYPD